MSRKDAFLEHLRDIKRAVDALMEEIETGGLPYGEYSGEGPVDEPPTEEPPTEEPPVEEPPAEPDPAPDPTPPPATPNPPATNDDLVDGLRDGRTPCGVSGGVDVANCTDPGVVVLADEVRITQALPSFTGWDIGTRKMVFTARVGVVSIYSNGGRSGSAPLLWVKPGGGFDLMEYSSFIDQVGSMVLKQEPGGIAGEITRCDFRGMSQDAMKVGGSNLIHENLFADAVYRGGSPHSDVLTVMSAEGDVVFRNNYVDWVYLDQSGAVMSDQSGINNWFRIEAYPAYSGRYDDVIIEGNALRHANGTSFAMQVTGKNSPQWDGSIKVRNNRMEKAGGNRKILYAPSSRISEWSGNTDFAGDDIPYSAT